MSEDARVEKTVQKKSNSQRDWKGLLVVVGVMSLAIAGLSLVYPRLSQLVNKDKRPAIIEDIIRNSNYDGVEEYVDFLEIVDADENKIELYLEDGEATKEYFFTIYNPLQCGYVGEISIWNEKGKFLSTLDFGLVRPKMYGFVLETCNSEPYDYVIEKVKFLKLNYPNVDFDYEYVYDFDDVNEWYNCELGNLYSVEAAKKIAQYQYVWNVLASYDFDTLYFYDQDVSYYEVDGYQYANTASAKYKAEIDIVNREIVFYENQNLVFKEIERVEVK